MVYKFILFQEDLKKKCFYSVRWYRVEWNGIFYDFWCCRSGIFLWVQYKFRRFFKKIQGPLKMNTYFRKFCKYLPITSKNNHQNKFKIIFFLYLQGLPKWANWCLTRSKENKISSLSSLPAFKKPKEDIPPSLRLKSRKTFKLIVLLPI